LYVSHNHPSVRPGGAEAYALELYEAMRTSDEFEPIFLAKGGPPMSTSSEVHEGTVLSPVREDDANQYFFYTDASDFDWFYGTLRNKDVVTKDFHEFLVTYRPDIVHFQHTLFLGYDFIRQTKNTLPGTPIVYTLHELLPICHRHGQMVRTGNEELCHKSLPRRCHECFPEISSKAFFARKSFIQSHLSLVDLFLVPSYFLLERYIDWGIPPEKIRYEEYGRLPSHQMVDTEYDGPRNRIGFFGQFSFYKGTNVLLKAMNILARDKCDVHLWLHGANLRMQPKDFQEEFSSLLGEATKENVTLVGRYAHAELPKLMANIDWVVVPSIWWENSPLVIQEAFQYGRPVICSDIGGMAEKVTDGVNGLHFRVNDPISLAQTICRAVSSPGLWQRLRSGIPDIYGMENHVATLSELYRTLLAHKSLHRGDARAKRLQEVP
jgi:glycosyltransferase involved in cell wall biosynthesis